MSLNLFPSSMVCDFFLNVARVTKYFETAGIKKFNISFWTKMFNRNNKNMERSSVFHFDVVNFEFLSSNYGKTTSWSMDRHNEKLSTVLLFCKKQLRKALNLWCKGAKVKLSLKVTKTLFIIKLWFLSM